MKSYKARGIVLHSIKYGENALILYLLTDTLGRRTYMVQGARGGRGKGNKTALFQPMFIVEFEGLESTKMELHRMKDVRSAMVMRSLASDIRKSTISLFMAETLYRLIKESEPNRQLFDFIYSSVETLDRLEEGVANFHLWFLVKLSYLMGFYPGNEYTPGCWFDISEGVFTPIEPTHGLVFDRDNTHLLSMMMECEEDGIGKINLSREARSSFLNAILRYFGYHLNSITEVKSIRILKEVF